MLMFIHLVVVNNFLLMKTQLPEQIPRSKHHYDEINFNLHYTLNYKQII